MDKLNPCHNRPQQPRVNIEVCRYHVETKDKVCMKKLNGILVCHVARQLMEGKGNEKGHAVNSI